MSSQKMGFDERQVLARVFASSFVTVGDDPRQIKQAELVLMMWDLPDSQFAPGEDTGPGKPFEIRRLR